MSKFVNLSGSVPTPDSPIPPALESKITSGDSLPRNVETDPKAAWIFIVEQLNIHKRASLVRLVAACCDLDMDLGVNYKVQTPV